MAEVDAHELELLPEGFLNAIGIDTSTSVSETNTIAVTVDATVPAAPVFKFDGDALDGSETFNEGDVYIFDTSAVVGYSFVLSSSADAADALGTADGVETDGTTITYTVPADVADGTAAIHVIGLDLTSAPVPVAGMGTDGTNGVPLTDAINLPALQVSTENFDWGGGYESTYVLDGTILGYSETHDMGSSDTNTSYRDASGNHVGHSYENEWGSGSHFTLVQTDTDGSITGTTGAQYIQEFGKNINVFDAGQQTEYEEAREWTYNYEYDDSNSSYGNTGDLYMMMGDFLGGSETFDGVTTLWGPNWTNLGQKSEPIDANNLAVIWRQLQTHPHFRVLFRRQRLRVRRTKTGLVLMRPFRKSLTLKLMALFWVMQM